MTRINRITTLGAACLFVAGACLADATVDQKTKVQFGGALGGVINVFGGRATKEGVSSTMIVKGDRRLSRTDDAGELVDLKEEKVYTIDFGRKTYTVKTFDQIRKEWEDAQKRAKEQSDESADKKKNEGPEYEVDFDVKNTGKKETINGFDTHQVIVTVTVREKGKKLEQSGGLVLTSDMWMGPKMAAMTEVGEFERRYAQKLYGNLLSGADMRQMAALMATTPTFGKAMKAFNEKKGTLDGTPVRTNMTFETVAGTEQKKEARSNDDGGSADSPGALVGSLLGRAMKKRQESTASSEPGRSTLFNSQNELLQASTSADAAALAIPAGFKLRG